MEDRITNPATRDADPATATDKSEAAVGDKAADAATDLYVEQERLDRRKRFERVVHEASTA